MHQGSPPTAKWYAIARTTIVSGTRVTLATILLVSERRIEMGPNASVYTKKQSDKWRRKRNIGNEFSPAISDQTESKPDTQSTVIADFLAATRFCSTIQPNAELARRRKLACDGLG